QPGCLAWQRLARQDDRLVTAEQVDIPGECETETPVAGRPGTSGVEEGDFQVHYRAAGQFLVKRRVVLDRMAHQHPEARPVSHGRPLRWIRWARREARARPQ